MVMVLSKICHGNKKTLIFIFTLMLILILHWEDNMKNNKSVKSGLQAIIVMFQYEDFGEQIEERHAGFLTGSNHAMYLEGDTLMIVPVKPTNEPSVYLAGDTMELGVVHDPSQSVSIIESTTKNLNNMTAYEFLTKVMLNVSQDVDFEDMIVPASARSNFMNAIESGVV